MSTETIQRTRMITTKTLTTALEILRWSIQECIWEMMTLVTMRITSSRGRSCWERQIVVWVWFLEACNFVLNSYLFFLVNSSPSIIVQYSFTLVKANSNSLGTLSKLLVFYIIIDSYRAKTFSFTFIYFVVLVFIEYSCNIKNIKDN